MEDFEEYPVWRLHPNRVFFDECPMCNSPNSENYKTKEGILPFGFLIPYYMLTFYSTLNLSVVEMDFADRQRAKFAACKNALRGLQPNPPSAALKGSNSEAPPIPPSTTIASQRSDSSQRK